MPENARQRTIVMYPPFLWRLSKDLQRSVDSAVRIRKFQFE